MPETEPIAGSSTVPAGLPGEIEQPDAVAGVLQVRRDERVVDHDRRGELVGRFRDHLDRRSSGRDGIDRDDPAAGRAVVRSEEETPFGDPNRKPRPR